MKSNHQPPGVRAGVRAGMASLAMLALALGPQAHAEPNIGAAIAHDDGQTGTSRAESLRRLDIMLMVTGLRCRNTDADFQADFADFEAHHLGELNAASQALRADLEHAYGAREANVRIDRISVAMANQYGNGHPWLGCADLKAVAQELAVEPGEGPLLAAADELLAGQEQAARLASDNDAPPVEVAYAQRWNGGR